MLKVAIMYDVDQTLSPNYMQEYSLLPMLNVNPSTFWKNCNDFAIEHNMDGNLGYMFKILERAKEQNISIKYQDLKDQGKHIKFFAGMEEYFGNINKYANNLGLEIDHYVISSGLKEMIEGTSIAHNFKRIFASRFAYDENDVAFWPAQNVNFTTKTQYIFRIKKEKIDNLHNEKEVNAYIADKSTVLPYTRMLYLGDGFTDIPCFKVIKDKKGTAICVYNEELLQSKKDAEKIIADGRVNFIAPADYREGSRLYNILCDSLNKIAADAKLNQY